jgi:hypothetical protein
MQWISLALSKLRLCHRFPAAVVSTLGCLHSLDVDSIADISDVYSASIFRVEVGSMSEVFFKRNIGASSAPIGTLELRTFSLSTLLTDPDGPAAPIYLTWCFLKEYLHKHGNSPTLHISTLKMEAARTSETSAILFISSWCKDPTAETTLAF